MNQPYRILIFISCFTIYFIYTESKNVSGEFLIKSNYKYFKHQSCENKICLNICDEKDLEEPIFLNTSIFGQKLQYEVVNLRSKREYKFVLNVPCKNASLLAASSGIHSRTGWSFFKVHFNNIKNFK